MKEINFPDYLSKERKEKILSSLAKRGKETRAAEYLTLLYRDAPYEDVLNGNDDVFEDAAFHAAFLRENSPFSKDLDENTFLAYVLQPRVWDEELCACRTFFYDMISERIDGMDFAAAVREINLFCAENVLYRPTDDRTRSARAVYESGFGRCSEESVFAVNVLRACGIPARRVYVPAWSHCDDNHAWVEVFDGREWYFTGACEPEYELNRGWFNFSASRAMLVCTAPLGPNSARGSVDWEKEDADVTARYARVKKVNFLVLEQDGTPIENADISCSVLNGAAYREIKRLKTDENGRASGCFGCGSLFVRVELENFSWGELLNISSLAQGKTVEFRRKAAGEALPTADAETLRYRFRAPAGGKVQKKDGGTPFSEAETAEKIAFRARVENAKQLAERKREAYYNQPVAISLAQKCDSREQVIEILKTCGPNFEPLVKLLRDKQYPFDLKLSLLLSLSKKDLTDASLEVLYDSLLFARPYRGRSWYDEEIFESAILCPRVENEPLSCYREALMDYAEENGLYKKFLEQPEEVYLHFKERYREFGDGTQNSLSVLLPKAGLTAPEIRGERSLEILTVAMLRALGVPARLDPLEGKLQYFEDGNYVFLRQEDGARGKLVLKKNPFDWREYKYDFSLERVEPCGKSAVCAFNNSIFGYSYKTALNLTAGRYRLISCTRLPSGDQEVVERRFVLRENETLEVWLERPEINFKELLLNEDFPDLSFTAFGGGEFEFKWCCFGHIFIFLKPNEEPSVHLMQELKGYPDRSVSHNSQFIFVFPKSDEKTGEKWAAELKSAIFYSYFALMEEKEIEALCERLGYEECRFPLLLLVTSEENERGRLRFQSMGYNVGSGKMAMLILDLLYDRHKNAKGRGKKSKKQMEE